MFSSFKARRPWAVAAIFLLFGPFIGMLYLNRGKLSFLYLVISYLAAAGALLFLSPVTLFAHGLLTIWLIGLPINLVGLIQGIMIARRRDPDERFHWYARWYTVVGIIFIFPVLALLIRTFLFQPFDARSESMMPTLNIGDYFLVKKFAYNLTQPRRGDLIVFNSHEGSRRVQYIKRIVGLPGDRIQMIGGKVYINGMPPNLQKVADVKIDCDLGSCKKASEFNETLAGAAPHRILQMTTDGPLDNTTLVTIPANSYFVLGDNRDNSDDSRMDLGFISAHDIVGKVAMRYVDGQSHRWVWQPIE